MNRPDEHDPIARAAAALDLPPDTTGAAATAEFLRKLPAENFAPPEEWVAALNRLAGTGLPLTPDALATEADELRSDVDAFAAAFWELPPDDRRAKWSALYARCADKSHPIAAFLRHLEAGLGMTVVAHPNKVADELAGLVRELFVLRPRPRAVRRAAWMAERTGGSERWSHVARMLAADAPEVEALDPWLIDRLKQPDGAPASVRERAPLSPSERKQEERLVQKRLERLTKDTGKRKPQPELAWWSGGIWVMVMVGAGILRGLVSTSNTSLPPPAINYSSPPPLPSGSFNGRPWGGEVKPLNTPLLTPEQEKSIRDYKPGNPRPAGVSEALWRLAGGDPKAPPPTGRSGWVYRPTLPTSR